MSTTSRIFSVVRIRAIAQAVLTSGSHTLLVNALALVGITLVIAGHSTAATIVSAVGIVLVIVFTARFYFAADTTSPILPTSAHVTARALIALTLAFVHIDTLGSDAIFWVAIVILAAAFFLENSVASLARAAVPFAEHLPGIAVRNSPPIRVSVVFLVDLAALVVAEVLLVTGAPVSLLLADAIIALAFGGFVGGDALLRIVARQRAERVLNARLEEYAPAFAVHWEAPIGTAYQLGMWLPYLERLGKPFIVVVRNPATFDEITKLTTKPVVLRVRLEDMDSIVTPSIKAFFYVNNATKNGHLIRYIGQHHIQLNHGDSDKAPSYNPVFRMYDRNFVAGQAAIDRFAKHGVEVQDSAFVIVGRPQVENIAVTTENIGDIENKTVLYAPTWAGFHKDANYSSLPVGYPIVKGLIDRGARVIFRPHPYSNRSPRLMQEVRRIIELLEADKASSARDHVFGPVAEREWDIVTCFNEADALVSDISSVVPDFLFSEKPFAVVSMQPSRDREAFLEEFPIAKAAYVIERDLKNLDGMLDAMLGDDSLAVMRRELKVYYLGEFDTENYADGFVRAATPYVS